MIANIKLHIKIFSHIIPGVIGIQNGRLNLFQLNVDAIYS